MKPEQSLHLDSHTSVTFTFAILSLCYIHLSISSRNICPLSCCSEALVELRKWYCAAVSKKKHSGLSYSLMRWFYIMWKLLIIKKVLSKQKWKIIDFYLPCNSILLTSNKCMAVKNKGKISRHLKKCRQVFPAIHQSNLTSYFLNFI